MTWALVPAAGNGRRFGGEVPKQYLHVAGRPLLEHALRALLSHPGVDGAVVALAPDDAHWPGWTTLLGKPVLACVGGSERADSVLAALRALPEEVGPDALVLVHDAARPNLHAEDITRLLESALLHEMRDLVPRMRDTSSARMRHCIAAPSLAPRSGGAEPRRSARLLRSTCNRARRWRGPTDDRWRWNGPDGVRACSKAARTRPGHQAGGPGAGGIHAGRHGT